jgi:DNA (cytosine-5)-methyltransferase 1
MARARALHAVDLFCGGGGTSTGLALAVQALGHELGRDVRLMAINHWEAAVATHKENHPWAEHRCERVEAVNRSTVFPGEALDLLVASPECVHFSVARGGRPVDDQRRTGAWYVLDWIADRRPGAVLIENVPEFVKWGRIRGGKQQKHTEGDVFRAYLRAFRALGYNVGYGVLNAADYGAATTRRRLFVMARRGRAPIHWPVPTHSKGGKAPGTKPWRAAREILDFTLPSQSIFGRSRPLAQRTLDRIAAGIRRGPHGQLLEPLARAVESCQGPLPLGSLLGQEGRAALQAYTLGQHGGAALRSVEDPVATIAAGGAVRLIEALLVGTAPRDGVAQPFLLPPEGLHRGNAPRSVEDPVPTVTAQRGAGHVVEPGILHLTHGARAHDTAEPLPTITGANRGELALSETALVLPHFGEREGQALRVRPAHEPLPTVHGSGAGSLAYLASYYGRGEAVPVDEPMGTATTRDRFALVEALLAEWFVDVRLRMLHPKELAAAMGFPPTYKFTGNRGDVVRQIGNAVEVNVARALVASLLTDARQPVLDVLPTPRPEEAFA